MLTLFCAALADRSQEFGALRAFCLAAASGLPTAGLVGRLVHTARGPVGDTPGLPKAFLGVPSVLQVPPNVNLTGVLHLGDFHFFLIFFFEIAGESHRS